MSAIADRTYWDSVGNKRRVEMHFIGGGVFELYLHDFNGAIPRLVVGPLGELNAKADIFIQKAKEAGFEEQLPSYNPDAWRA